MRVQVSEAHLERDDEPFTARGVLEGQHLHSQHSRHALVAFNQEFT